MNGQPAYRICVAPMMEWTDRHCRYFLRQITRQALLYTEMVTADAILHGDRERLLGHDPAEHPVALQLGGSEPGALAECARIGAGLGYDEINLNVGCPSDRVQSGRFGACLMREPDLVARCVEAMKSAVAVPVTVKSRVAVDEQDEWPTLSGFVGTVRAAGADRMIVHARKAWLEGLSPKENREVPPLRHDLVHRLKAEFEDCAVVINGGIGCHDEIERHLAVVDGVMLGRSAYRNPWLLADVDRRYFGDDAPAAGRDAVASRMIAYIERETVRGTPVRAITRHMMGLYQGMPGARAWRRYLSENVGRADTGPAALSAALDLVEARGAAAAE